MSLSENLEKSLNSMTPEELQKLWERLEPFNHVGPLAIDFIEEMQNFLNVGYKYVSIKKPFNKGKFNKGYTKEIEYCLAA